MKLFLSIIVLLFSLIVLRDWIVDLLWFSALGYSNVFWLLFSLRIGSFIATFVLLLGYCWVNIRHLATTVDLYSIGTVLFQQFSLSVPPGSAAVTLSKRLIKVPQTAQSTGRVLILIAAVIAAVAATTIAGQWDTVLRYWWAVPYGSVDPVYGRDIGFFLFVLPFLNLVQNTILMAAFLVLSGLISLYASVNMFSLTWSTPNPVPPAVRRHVALNLALFLAAFAWGYYLDRYELLLSSRGVVFGAGFADINVVRPVLWTLIAAALALAVSILYPPVISNGRRFLTLIGAYLLMTIIGLGLLPWFIQAFYVAPNELHAEETYLKHNIALTLEAYDLREIKAQPHRVSNDLSFASIERSRQTIDNIRLWDWRPLGETFRQLQQIRSYYTFGDVDVDRYRIDGTYRQVMIAARELATILPRNADTWVNRHLQYTHGYGVAMSLAAEKDPQGGPVLVVKDLPPLSSVDELALDRPEVYFSDKSSGHRIVSTTVPELDYPKGDENVYSSYQGNGGILLNVFWKRLLFAWYMMDVNISISNYITPQSRLQLWRNIHDRVKRLAPFLRLDNDPYPIISDGKLYWMQDAYTVSSNFPYSEPYSNDINYIRNSVKIVVDAYQGSVAFYIMEPDDPVLHIYRRAMPEVFRSFDDMPESLREHIRYPQDLFEIQVNKYSRYHMKSPQVFYNSEDSWSAPRETYAGEIIDMKPYYVLMKLPGETRLQFLLMTPLTPDRRDNLIAWMAATSSAPGYGELLVYKLPKEHLIVGPKQIEAMIDQDTLISQQLSLWDQRGSRVIRGNLLVIPIESTFLYVEPVYLIADSARIPQLKRIIVSDGRRLAMEPTLEQALAVVLNQQRESTTIVAEEKPGSLVQVRAAFNSAEQALRDGDWDKFGNAMHNLKELLLE